MKSKIPILLLTRDRPSLLEKVLVRLLKFTNWDEYDLWILDNFSSPANKKVIALFKDNYPFINVYSVNFNQLSVIQNNIIKQLKADFYIKLDDDILVTENWTNAFVEVYQRNYGRMSFGSVILPINGFGWVPFLKIMKLEEEFKARFPEVPLNQSCFEPAVVNNFEVNEFIWNHCLNMDQTSKTFINNQDGNFQDLICPHRYSIGAIVFSHKFWEEMGGWKVQDGYDKKIKKQGLFQKAATSIKALARQPNPHFYSNINVLADILAGTYLGLGGVEEEAVFQYSQQKGLVIPVTTQGIAFHFAFGNVDQHLMNKIYLKLN